MYMLFTFQHHFRALIKQFDKGGVVVVMHVKINDLCDYRLLKFILFKRIP